MGVAGKDEGQGHPENQVGECGSHKLPHSADATQNPVGSQFGGYYEIERGKYP